MVRLNDPQLVAEQYRDQRNLDARIALHRRFSTSARDFHAWVFDHFDWPANARVLELGCGTGALWSHSANRPRVPASWEVTLSDLSRGMLQSARSANIRARFLQLDAQAIPFLDGSFDAVVANHMLYHILDLPRALGEIRRVLGDDGKLYAATNGAAHMREYFQLRSEILGVELFRPSMQFTLENGAAQLQEHFSHVERLDFDDALMVTETEPLVRYALSAYLGEKMYPSEKQTELRRAISEKIARDGAVRITKSTGLFIATNRMRASNDR